MPRAAVLGTHMNGSADCGAADDEDDDDEAPLTGSRTGSTTVRRRGDYEPENRGWCSRTLSAFAGVATGLVLVWSPSWLLADRESSEPVTRDVPSVLPRHLFVFGIVCNERQHSWRARLRKLYGAHAPNILSIFVVLDDYRTHAKWQQLELKLGERLTEDVLYVPAMVKAERVEKHHAYREAHCSHKTMGWWKLASRWPSQWYGKTDDDAVIDLPPLLLLLARMPSGPVYGGIVHYSSVNLTNLEGTCFASGAYTAARQRLIGLNAALCPAGPNAAMPHCQCSQVDGPYPYVEGPLEILSSDVQVRDRA